MSFPCLEELLYENVDLVSPRGGEDCLAEMGRSKEGPARSGLTSQRLRRDG